MINNREDDDAPDRRRLYRMLGLAGLLAVPLVIIWWPGCRQYPPVSSRESLSLMKLLYAACNTRDEKRLANVENGVENLTREGKMTPEERAGFERIIKMARAGKWEDAEKAAFKFAQDQVGQGKGK
ncbi:MAG: hypothetical protein K8T89_12890 [Planctomycetes bacterium]|nr:hypothetical protein [Planctomycetota bacterium]